MIGKLQFFCESLQIGKLIELKNELRLKSTETFNPKKITLKEHNQYNSKHVNCEEIITLVITQHIKQKYMYRHNLPFIM
jgi:hypothetical protein